MRKYIIGILIGFSISFAISAHANVELMKGKVVQDVISVFINNEQVTDAILVDEKAYAPLREVGEKAGYKVAYGEDRVIRMVDNRVKIPFESSIEVNKFNELTTQQKDMTNQIIELAQTLTAYEKIIMTKEGSATKPKDDLYYNTKQKRDNLISERNLIDQQLKEVSEQIKESKNPK